MATKKKKPARKAPRKAAARRPQAAPSLPSPTPVIAPSPASGGLLPLVTFAVVVLAAWLIVRGCRSKAVAPPMAPAAPAAAAPATPEARSVAPAAAPTPDVPKPKTQAHREDAGAETGAPSLTFDRSQEKSLKVRCWRAAGGQAQLDVFAPHNRVVAKLSSAAGPAGWVDLAWDGKDASGTKVATGLYFLRPSQRSEETVRDVWVKD